LSFFLKVKHYILKRKESA